ncbi:MAG: SURF1 family protein [Lysobacter sp.]|nr:SURF1 family protein [Lysobacter sp.]
MNLRRHPLFLWAIALLALALFARLGFWQLERAAEKRERLENVAAVLAARLPQSSAVIVDTGRAQAYDWVDLEGGFADGPMVLLDNQQLGGVAGVRAYRVFVSNEGARVLLDLGWVALPPDRTLPRLASDPARLRLSGLLLPPPGQGIDVGGPVAQPDGTLLATAIDLPTLRTALKQPTLAPRVFRPEPQSGFGFERDFDILPNTLPPERHLGYAVQWFGLAATVLITALLLTWRARRAAAHRNDRLLP